MKLRIVNFVMDKGEELLTNLLDIESYIFTVAQMWCFLPPEGECIWLQLIPSYVVSSGFALWVRRNIVNTF